MDELPLPALQLVLRLALETFNDDPTARTTSVCAPALQQLATVCRRWRSAMTTVLDAHRCSTRGFTLECFDTKLGVTQAITLRNREVWPNSADGSRVVKIDEPRPARSLAPPPSTRIARSVASFFSSIVGRAHAQHAFPWEDDGTEQVVTPVDDTNHDMNALAPAATTTPTTTSVSVERAFERHLVREIQRVKASLLTTDSGSVSARKLVELRLREADVSPDPTSGAAQHESLWCASALQREWDSVFQCCPGLQRLDLASVSLLSPHLPAVLVAASTHCQALKALVLPQQECLGYQRRNVQPVFDALYAALANWGGAASRNNNSSSDTYADSIATTLSPAAPQVLAHRRQRGLRRLVMPKLFAYEFYDEHMTRIAQCCHMLEYIDGLRLAPIFQARGLSHHDVMRSWLHAWAAFCAACTRLRDWNWFEIPFVDAFFVVFAAQPKCHLRTLTLPGNTTLWKRDYVYEAHQEPANCSCTPDGMRAMLRACPRLTTLQVLFSDRHLMFGSDNPFLIGDAFLAEVVRACPLLETLRLTEAEARHGFEATNAITPDGVASLAALAHLHIVELSGVAMSGDALFVLATQRHADISNYPRRRVRATVGVRGVRKIDIAVTFNRILTELLELLIQSNRDGGSDSSRTLPCFVLKLRIDTANYQLPAHWATPFRRKWMALKHELASHCRPCGAKLHVSFDVVRAVVVIRSGR